MPPFQDADVGLEPGAAKQPLELGGRREGLERSVEKLLRQRQIIAGERAGDPPERGERLADGIIDFLVVLPAERVKLVRGLDLTEQLVRSGDKLQRVDQITVHMRAFDRLQDPRARVDHALDVSVLQAPQQLHVFEERERGRLVRAREQRM